MYIGPFNSKLYKVAIDRKIWMRILGQVEYHNIWFLRVHEHVNLDAPNLLVCGGFHGEEIAGPMAIIDWLGSFDPNLYKNVNLSFIPMVNPSAFSNNSRYNYKRQRSNCGFCHPENGDLPSEEGIILLRNSKLIQTAARDGFLSLHEDATSKEFYLYTFERESQPTNFTFSMRDKMAEFFGKCVHKEYITTDASSGKGVLVENGIAYKLCDGSCEDWLFHEGTSRAVVTETPGTAHIGKRVKANKAILEEFIRLSIELYEG